MTVTDLAVWDDEGNGLVQSHDVGIYRVSDETLLVSGTVPSGTCATVVDQFCVAWGSNPSLAYPTLDGSAFDKGVFGPNFQFDAAAAPEPGPAMLLVAGASMPAYWKRRRNVA